MFRFPKNDQYTSMALYTFFVLALLGGTLGAIAGMYAFRHKTRHWYFRYGLPAILLAQIALALWLAGYFPR